jgi:uncharacterized protein
MRENHNRSRRYRPGFAAGQSSSFDEATRLVDALLDSVRVDIRLNIGPHNLADVEPFLAMARARGWFRKRYSAVIQPARLSAFTDHCGFLRRHEMPQDDFDRVRTLIRKTVGRETLVEESEAPDGLPLPRTSVCAALARNSAVIGADGLEYRCGLQVGQREQAAGRALSEPSPFKILTSEEFPEGCLVGAIRSDDIADVFPLLISPHLLGRLCVETSASGSACLGRAGRVLAAEPAAAHRRACRN